MRLRSKNGGDGPTAPRHGRLATVYPIEGDLPLLPEQVVAVRKLQQSTGRSFSECAVELRYLPANAKIDERLAPTIGGSIEPASDVDPLVVMLTNPEDLVAGAARELRSSLATMRNRASDPLRRVALLSLQSGPEASILAANLAVAYAIAGQRTLLIDANLVAGIQHALFRRNGSNGVCQLLAAHTDGRDMIQGTAVPNLYLLPNGSGEESAVELTDRSALALTTEAIADNYEMVIVDAGEADQIGLSCAQGFDGTVVVVQRDVTALSDARKVIDRVRSCGDSPVGMVIID